jgi:NlpC/P60 family putative phage cell wall peptidase
MTRCCLIQLPHNRATEEVDMGIKKVAGPGASQLSWPALQRAMTSFEGRRDHIIAIARSWIGTPYVHQASVKGAGCDCLGLLRGIWRELHGEEPEDAPPYSPDWAEATGEETLYRAFNRHLAPVERAQPGDVALFRMARHGPAKHCGVIALMQRSDSALEMTLIHARQNKRVSEEAFSPFWQNKLAAVFRM